MNHDLYERISALETDMVHLKTLTENLDKKIDSLLESRTFSRGVFKALIYLGPFGSALISLIGWLGDRKGWW